MTTLYFHQKHHAFTCRHYQWRGKCYSAVTVMQLFGFNEANQRFPQQALYTLNHECLRLTNGELFDIGMPKPKAELLATGYCFPAEGSAKKSFVRIQLGEQQKTLAVYGNRYWQGVGIASVMTAPETFSKMPITNSQAFGGEGYLLNPLGKGIAYVEPLKQKNNEIPTLPKMAATFPNVPQTPQKAQDQSQPKMFSYPLPNTEAPDDLILKKTDMPKPATFYPIAYSNRERTKKFGTFDEKWLNTTWPQFTDDMQWDYYMCSADNQQQQEFYRGDEYFSIENMHPEKPLIKGQLPLWGLRCFAEKERDAGNSHLHEIDMKLDTVWFMPEQEKGVLVWHGYTEVDDVKASNLVSVLAEDEGLLSERKDIAYYENLLKEKKKKPNLAERRKEFKAKLKPHQEAAKEKAWDDFAKSFKDLQKHLDNVKESIKNSKVDLRNVPGAGGMTSASITEALSIKLKRHSAEELTKEFEALKKQHSLDVFKKGMPLKDSLDKINKLVDDKVKKSLAPHVEELKKHNVSIDNIIKHARKTNSRHEAKTLGNTLKHIAETTENKKLQAAILAAAATYESKVVDGKMARELGVNTPNIFYTREQVEVGLQTEQSFENAQMHFLDLKNLDFSGLNLYNINMVHCNLRHCDFSRSNLTRALLTGSDLTYANLSHSTLLKSNFHQAILKHSDFSYADLEHSIFTHTNVQRCNFLKAELNYMKVVECNWQHINFQGASGNKVIMMNSTLRHINLRDASFVSAKFIKSDCHEIDFSGGDFSKSMFSEIHFEKFPVEKSKLETCKFNKCTILNGNFNQTQCTKTTFLNCTLKNCIFTQADLSKATFSGCNGDQIKLVDTCLVNSRMTRQTCFTNFYAENCDGERLVWMTAQLSNAIFKRCSFNTTCFDQANLNQAQFLYCAMSQSRFVGTDLSQAKLYGCDLNSTMLRETRITQSTFKQCNLYDVDFFHAVTKETVMVKNLMKDPLPSNFESHFIHG